MSQSLIIEQFIPQSTTELAHLFQGEYPHPDLCASKLFAAIANRPWAMLLHSGNCDHQNSQFDIIVANPIAHISSYQHHSYIFTSTGDHQVITGDPLTWIKNAINQHLNLDAVQSCQYKLPFFGGALGYFGYDLGSQYEVLPQNAEDDMNTPAAKVGIYDWAIIKDNHSNTWSFVSHRLTFEQVIQLFSKTDSEPWAKPNFRLTSNWQSNLDKQQYQQRYHQVHEYLNSGDCYQINLAQRFNASFQGDDYQAFQQLMAVNSSPFSAYLHFDDFSVLSVSPERLLQLQQNQIETKPIKGTIKRHPDPKQDEQQKAQLQQSSKDRAENVMIVDLLRNDIGRVSVAGSVKVPHLFAIESFPAVHHLVSTVTGQLKPDLHATDVLRAAFPGGSITGAPKVRAMEIIDELEPHRRSVYCGSIGYICCTGNMDTSITIRTLLCKNQQIYCWAGGGIVADSSCESEYQETYAKVSKILPVLDQMSGTTIKKES